MAQAHYGMSLALLEAEYERLSSTPSPDLVDVINLVAFHIHFRLGPARTRTFALLEEAQTLAATLHYAEGMVMAELTRGFIALRDSDKERVEGVFRNAMAQAEQLGNPVLQAHALALLALWCNRYGGEGDALSYCLMAHDLLAKEPWDVIGRIVILNQLGYSYSQLRQFESAARYWEECHTLCMGIEDYLRGLITRCRLAETWYESQRYDDALALAEEGREDCEALMPTHTGLSSTYADFIIIIAKIWMQRGNDVLAQTYAQRACRWIENLPQWQENEIFVQTYFSALTVLGTLWWRAGNVTEALALLNQAIEFKDRNINRTSLAGIHLTLSQIYREIGDFEKALLNFEHYHDYRAAAEAIKHYEQIQIVYQMSNAIMVQHATFRLHQENAKLQQVVANLHMLHLQVRDSAQRDSLTQLFNRRYLEEQLPRLLLESRRSGQPFSVAMVDFDNFKQINDTFRHSTGDVVLQTVTDLIQRHLTSTDIAVRYGGDEILLLFPATSGATAQKWLEKIRRAIHTYAWAEIAHGLQVTISVGLATAQLNDDGQSLIDRADAHLLAAKRSGKNQLLMVAS
jgi:diguanylate cyclase (GGDEF)-like protein